MLVGLVDYFPIFLNGSSDGSRENGNDRYLTLFEIGKCQDIFFEGYDKNKHDKYDLIIFKNEPRIQDIISIVLRNIYKKKINIFYLADETPLSRKRISILIPFLYKRILINTFENNKTRKNFNHYFYTQPHIPSREKIINNKDFILNKKRKNLFCFVGSNVLSISDKGSYKFRHKILNGLSKFSNFSLYGRKWDQAVIPIDFPLLAVINRLNLIKNIILNFYKKKYPLIKNKGPVSNKISTLNNYKFTLAIEPYIGKPRMLLEKIFDPMLCGSIPVYYGPEGLDIPNNIYIRIKENVVPEDLIKYLESFDESQLVEYRTRIYNYLLSNEAERYRNEFWAKIILKIIK